MRLPCSAKLVLILALWVSTPVLLAEQEKLAVDPAVSQPVVPPIRMDVSPSYNGPLSCAYHCVCPYTCLDASPCEGARIHPKPDNSQSWPYTTQETMACIPAPCSERDPAKAQKDCYFHCKKTPNTKIGFFCPSQSSRTGNRFVSCKDRIVRPSSSTVTLEPDKCHLGAQE